MIDKALDRLARIIELVLAFAFIVGRYLFGLSLLGSDEVQVFIMVAMTFLGAVVVTRRNLHLRMDVLVRFMPGRPVVGEFAGAGQNGAAALSKHRGGADSRSAVAGRCRRGSGNRR